MMYAGAHDPDHPDVVAAHAALHGKDGDDPQSHAMHLLVRAASKWGHERISRSFNSWLAVANKVSKRATSASVAHVLSVEPKHRTKDELDLVKAFLVGHHPTYFGTLPREGMDIVARAISMQQVERNEVLCMQGEVGAHFYVVMAGQIAVCAPGPPHGRRPPGGLPGDADERRPAAEAGVPGRVLRVDAADRPPGRVGGGDGPLHVGVRPERVAGG